MSRTRALRSEQILETTHARLLNWGAWSRQRVVHLGYPTKVSFMVFPSRGGAVDELDALVIEETVTKFRMGEFGMGKLHADVLKIEYCERPFGRSNTVEERARDLGAMNKIGCSRSRYFRLLQQARNAIQVFADRKN